MNLKDIKYAIQDALVKASLVTPAPDDHEGWATWAEWLSVYLYEFVIRSRQKGMPLLKAQRLAAKEMRRQIRNATSVKILNYELPQEVPDEESNRTSSELDPEAT